MPYSMAGVVHDGEVHDVHDGGAASISGRERARRTTRPRRHRATSLAVNSLTPRRRAAAGGGGPWASRDALNRQLYHFTATPPRRRDAATPHTTPACSSPASIPMHAPLPGALLAQSGPINARGPAEKQGRLPANYQVIAMQPGRPGRLYRTVSEAGGALLKRVTSRQNWSGGPEAPAESPASRKGRQGNEQGRNPMQIRSDE